MPLTQVQDELIGAKGKAKAWVYFNGTNLTINNGYNISSITRNGTGDYNINITSGALPNANFVMNATASSKSGTQSQHVCALEWTTIPTATLARLRVMNVNSAAEDDPYIFVSFFGA